jgi:ABC-type glycerol-3-phosphate transport system substrate-binding protein
MIAVFVPAAGGLIWGCGGGDDDVVTITVINQPRWSKNIEDAVEKWNSEHPDQAVKLNQLIIGYPQLKNKLMTAAGAGRPPDISLIDYVWLASFVETGHLAPLDSLDHEWFVNDYKKDFFQVFQEGEIIDGRLWGVRTQTDMALLWHRKDWLEREGLDPPETWAELVEVGKHFKKPEIREKYDSGLHPLAVPLGRKARETLVYELLPLFWSNKGGIFEGDSLAIDSKANVETLKFIRSLVEEHELVSDEAISFDWNRPAQLFATGKAALAFGGSYEKRMIQEIAGWSNDEFMRRAGFTLIPAPPAGTPSTTAGGMCYVIYALSDHKDLAMEIVKLAVSPEIQKSFLLESYQHPPRKSVAADIDEEKYPFIAATTEYLYKARARPSFAEYSELSDLIQEMIERAAGGNAEAEVAAAEAARDARALMAD